MRGRGGGREGGMEGAQIYRRSVSIRIESEQDGEGGIDEGVERKEDDEEEEEMEEEEEEEEEWAVGGEVNEEAVARFHQDRWQIGDVTRR